MFSILQMDSSHEIASLLSFVAHSSWITVTALTLLAIFLSTYAFTAVEAAIALRSRKRGRELPVIPYYLPILGNSVSFAWNPAGFVDSIT